MPEQHRCGRRDDMARWMAAQRGEQFSTAGLAQPDTWEERNDPSAPGLLGNGQRCCSYCGSMHPEDFLQAIETGWEVGPTDKNYKVYVTEKVGPGTFSKQSGRHHKFYFQHLDQAQQARFVELFNAKKMRIGCPGHFYAPPYFMRVTYG